MKGFGGSNTSSKTQSTLACSTTVESRGSSSTVETLSAATWFPNVASNMFIAVLKSTPPTARAWFRAPPLLRSAFFKGSRAATSAVEPSTRFNNLSSCSMPKQL